MDVAAEKQRFNELSLEDARAILDKAEGQQVDFRSCWYCNGAHERLKDRVMRCFVCGLMYLYGFPAPVVFIRSKGDAVTDEHMQKFEKILSETA